MHKLLHIALVSTLLLSAGTCVAADAPPPATTKPTAAAAPIPVADFVRDDSFEELKLSPGGQYLALSVNITDTDGRTKRVLVVTDRSGSKPLGHFNLAGKTEVQNFWWVGDKRLVISAGEKSGLLEKPRATGELFAMNADGSDQGILVGYRAVNMEAGSHINVGKRTEADAATMTDPLPNDPGHAIVAIWPHDEGASGFEKAARMDVANGQTVVLATAPVRNAEFTTDLQGGIRFAVGSNDDNMNKTYYRDGANAAWVLLNDETSSKIILTPLGFGADGHTAYLRREDAGNGPDVLVAYDTTTHTMKEVLRDPVADPQPVFGPRGELIAVRYLDGKPRTVFLDDASALAQSFHSLQASFPDQDVLFTGFTRDGTQALLYTYSDRSPGDYYLFDLASKKAVHLLSHRDWIDPDRMGSQRPVTLKARDGLVLHGFLTVPAGSNGKNLPLVINPHGGPFGIADTWGFDGEVQMLASRGYAVLQVNYRGSGGFGREFELSGYQQWGRTMQDDLTDATQWVIAQGIADPRRICIYGASYGGYAALMGVAKEPSLYRCAAGYVGVYDLPTMYHTGDTQDSKWGTNYLHRTLGDDNLESISPDHLADRITVPVLLAAGKEDERAPPIHTEKMRDALEKAGKPVQATIYAGEGHGFYLEADRESFYNSLLAFLDRNIGGGR
ncbi:MAG: S9 family peptidase [Proteobacteria bacterium]|nr:S9 family peptidase [Pseudomonadota bacterium]